MKNVINSGTITEVSIPQNGYIDKIEREVIKQCAELRKMRHPKIEKIKLRKEHILNELIMTHRCYQHRWKIISANKCN